MKKKSPTIISDEDGNLFAANRAARKMLKSLRVPHTPVPMPSLEAYGEKKLRMGGEEFTPQQKQWKVKRY